MKMIIAGTIMLTASYLYILYRLIKERRQHAKTRKRSRKDREILSYKIQTIEQKLDELEDLVFELLIRGEYRVGSDTGGLDNVAINAISGNATNFQGPEGDFSTLTRNNDGTFTRRMKDGTEYHFNADGLQTSMVDRNGNTTTYTYDADKRLTSITDPAGLVTTLTYSGGRLSRVTDPTGRETTFSHDANGNLVGVTLPDNASQSFGYDSRHLMTQKPTAEASPPHAPMTNGDA